MTYDDAIKEFEVAVESGSTIDYPSYSAIKLALRALIMAKETEVFMKMLDDKFNPPRNDYERLLREFKGDKI